jgi:Right handed beta helix region
MRAVTSASAAAALAGAILLVASLSVPPAADSESASRCDRYAAPGGSDGSPGTIQRPFRTAARLVGALRRGQVGCFRAGSYPIGALRIDRRGITLSAYRGERAVLAGDIKVPPSGRGSAIAGLVLDGSGGPSDRGPFVQASNFVLRGNSITNGHEATCVHITSYGSRRAPKGVRVLRNRIHNCGELPATNHQHGIYVGAARGASIKGNWIYGNADRGVQLYPAAQRTLVRGNIIDSNGWGVSIGGDDSGSCSNRNTVVRNVIANSRISWNVHSTPQGRPCRRNAVRRNCVYSGLDDPQQGSNGGVQKPSRSYRARRNRIAKPVYLDRAANDFRLRRGTACWRVVGR